MKAAVGDAKSGLLPPPPPVKRERRKGGNLLFASPTEGLTAAELGERLGRTEGAAGRLLDGLEELELVCRVGGAWRLSDLAELKYGPAFRTLHALDTTGPA